MMQLTPTENHSTLSFEDTEISFGYKTDAELQKARLLFSSMKFGWLVKAGTRMVPWALKWKLPVRGLIRNTIFKQFVGGETLEASRPVLKQLGQFNVKAILDYGAEGKEDEESFNKACSEFLKLIDFASADHDVPFISIKITGLARFELLEKVNTGVKQTDSALLIDTSHLNVYEAGEWKRVLERVNLICKKGAEQNVGILIDAEESWIQDTVDALAEAMMALYNKQHAIVFNTIQFYRTKRFEFLTASADRAKNNGFILAVKIVRGAYMEKERERASRLNYPSPIQPDKLATDDAFNNGLVYCLSNLAHISVIIASHNEYSNQLAVRLMTESSVDANHPHVHFSQLYGMSDNITFNMARAGFSVSKYLPYGPLDDVIPYLLRRAQENTSVKGQTGRELFLLNKEVARRRR